MYKKESIRRFKSGPSLMIHLHVSINMSKNNWEKQFVKLFIKIDDAALKKLVHISSLK